MSVLLTRTCVFCACLVAMAGCSDKTIEAYPAQLAGIGVVVKSSRGQHVVEEVIDGGPAAQAGLVAGARIVEVDGAPTKGRTLASVVDQLRGPDGSNVELRVQSATGVVTLSLKRGVLARGTGKAYLAR